MDEPELWRMRHVVSQLVEAVSGIVGLATGWLAYHLTTGWGWPDWLTGVAALVGFLIGSILIKKDMDLDLG